jgi:hypothetical protein
MVAGYDLSGDVGSIGSISGGPSPLEVTGIDKSAYERIGGKRDGALDFTAFFNPATDQAHPVLSALPTTDRIVSYLRGTTLGNPAASMNAKQIGYDPSRNEDGSLTFKIAAQANQYGLEWGEQATAGKIIETGAPGRRDVLDTLAGASFGMQGYLHVFAFTGTDVLIKVQHSTDDLSYSDITGGFSFTTITSAPVSQRITTALTTTTINQYLRVNLSTSGGFTSVEFAVAIVKNDTAVTF